MNQIKKLAISVLLIACMLVPMLSFGAFAAETITETVDISITRQAVKGEGFVWSQTKKTMTLTNLTIDTEDDYGLRLPTNATVVLNGDNYIRASQYALTALGSLKFTGDGTLTLVSDKGGLRMDSPEYGKELIFAGGKIKILAKETGIESAYPDVTLGGSEIEVSVSGENGISLNAHSVKCNDGVFKANAPIVSTNAFEVGATSLEITANSAAVTAETIKFGSSCKISAGDNASSLASVTEYSGQNCLTVSAPKSQKHSVIFAEFFGKKNVPVFWDYLLLALAVLLLAAVIVVPILVHRQKTKKKIAEVEAARAQRLEAKRAANREKKKNR